MIGSKLFRLPSIRRIVDEVKAKLPPIVEASYIVYREGDTYHVKDGWNGSIVFSGSDAVDAIQYAVNSAGDGGGGVVYLKRGQYVIKKYTTMMGCIVLSSNIALIGENGAELVVDPALTQPEGTELHVVYASNCENVIVKGLSIRGHAGIADGIRMDECKRVIIEDNRVQDFREDGITFYGANAEFAVIRNNYVANVDLVNGGNAGIEVDAQHVLISGNMLDGYGNATASGIVIKGRNIAVVGNTAKRFLRGINTLSTAFFTVNEGINIVGNVVPNCTDGIRTTAVRFISIVGNIVTDVDRYGIFISTDSEDVLVAGNVVVDTRDTKVMNFGINVYNARRVYIIGNRIAHSASNNIYVSGTTTDQIHIYHNDVRFFWSCPRNRIWG
jgi:hypothetical protein